MAEEIRSPRFDASFLGGVEPHAPLLTVPPDGQLLYKMMTVENLLRSIAGEYLHFNRVDRYSDFPGADHHDGMQLPEDQPVNASVRFEKAPNFSAADYYDQSRARTYACCFSLQNSGFIWSQYANGSQRGKVCVVFDFAKLRSTLNRTLQPGNAGLDYKGILCHQIFSLNYGIVQYVTRDRYRANADRLPNPIIYTYMKDEQFAAEKELRISLATIGIGRFELNDGSLIDFPPSLAMSFDFRAAMASATIPHLLCSDNCDSDYLNTELQKLRITPISPKTAEKTSPGSNPDLAANFDQ